MQAVTQPAGDVRRRVRADLWIMRSPAKARSPTSIPTSFPLLFFPPRSISFIYKIKGSGHCSIEQMICESDTLCAKAHQNGPVERDVSSKGESMCCGFTVSAKNNSCSFTSGAQAMRQWALQQAWLYLVSRPTFSNLIVLIFLISPIPFSSRVHLAFSQ